MNRIALGLPKTHYYDACSVGQSTPGKIRITQEYVQIWSATGRGTRRMCNPDKYGFPRAIEKHKNDTSDFRRGIWFEPSFRKEGTLACGPERWRFVLRVPLI